MLSLAKISAACAAAFFVASAAMGALAVDSGAVAKPDPLQQIAMVIAAPSDFTLFAWGVSGLIIGRLILGRRQRPSKPAAVPPVSGD